MATLYVYSRQAGDSCKDFSSVILRRKIRIRWKMANVWRRWLVNVRECERECYYHILCLYGCLSSISRVYIFVQPCALSLAAAEPLTLPYMHVHRAYFRFAYAPCITHHSTRTHCLPTSKCWVAYQKVHSNSLQCRYRQFSTPPPLSLRAR